MIRFVDSLMIRLKGRMEKAMMEFRDEAGVSSFVATILLILIVVLLCAMFWTSISQWFTDMWNKIMQRSNAIGG